MILYLIISKNHELVAVTTKRDPRFMIPEDELWFVFTENSSGYCSLDIDDILRGDSEWRPYNGKIFIEDTGNTEVYEDGKLITVIEND